LLEQVLSRATAYTALNDAIKPLEEIIPDEMTRYRAAFAVIKKNRSLDQVIQAIDMQHMQAVDDEVARFAAQAKQKEVTDINVRVSEAQTLKDNVDAAGVQIVKLREETENRIRVVEAAVQRDRARLDEIERELLEKRQAIALVQTQFNTAVASVKDTLTQNKAKILRYLAP
jgi:chromosome segregation ATPase